MIKKDLGCIVCGMEGNIINIDKNHKRCKICKSEYEIKFVNGNLCLELTNSDLNNKFVKTFTLVE